MRAVPTPAWNGVVVVPGCDTCPMCGRYTQTLNADDLAAAMSAEDLTGGGVAADFNVAPTTTMPVVVGESATDDDQGEGAAAEVSRRVLRLARWGLVPSWASDVAIGSKMINARSESAAGKPAFRSALAKRRCLVPATGFYEWHRPGGGSRRGQPYFIHPAGDAALVAFAGLFEVWRRGDEPLTTFTILTTGSAAGLEFLHDRSPVVVAPGEWSRWLDPALTDPAAVADLLVPAGPGVFSAYPVGPAVGNVRNKGPELLEPFQPHRPDGEIPEVPGPRAVDLTLFDV